MTKVLTPAGEIVKVKRRWFPWSPLGSTKNLEKVLPPPVAHFFGRAHALDWAILGLLAVIVLLLASLSPLILLVTAALAIIYGLFWFLALPWHVEVLHRGQIIAADKMEGFSPSHLFMGRLAALYGSGALKVPGVAYPTMDDSDSVVKPGHNTGGGLPLLPKPAVIAQDEPLPDLEESVMPESLKPLLIADAPSPEEVELPLEEEPAFFHSAFALDDEPVLPVVKRVVPTLAHAPNESILRRVVRELEAEEAVLVAAGLMEPTKKGLFKRDRGGKKSSTKPDK